METAALSYSGSDLWVLCTEHSRLDHLSVCRTGNGVIGGGKVLETARGHGCREGVGWGVGDGRHCRGEFVGEPFLITTTVGVSLAQLTGRKTLIRHDAVVADIALRAASCARCEAHISDVITFPGHCAKARSKNQNGHTEHFWCRECDSESGDVKVVLIFRYLEVSVESAGRCDNRVCHTWCGHGRREHLRRQQKSLRAESVFCVPPQQDHGTSSCQTRLFPPMSS